MRIIGWAQFAWQADYGQFYLIDRDEEAFLAPQIFTPEMEVERVIAPERGLVVYTEDSLHQHVRIHIYDAEPEASPTEMMSGEPWTQVEELTARFPSCSFGLSSPSHPDPLPGGPVFFLPTDHVHIRVSWMEFQGERDESVPVQPNVIQVEMWPIWNL